MKKKKTDPFSCLGKVAHKSKISAEYYLKLSTNPNAQIYECKNCGFLHIGTLNNEHKNKELKIKKNKKIKKFRDKDNNN